MISAEIIKKIRTVELKTRKVVESSLAGDYHSAFKGQGLNFSEVKEYQPGEDVRLIDWNVTAKMGVPFIKTYEEERELTVVLMIDMSASGNFGSDTQTKLDMAAECAAILGFSAIRNNDRVGLLLFTDKTDVFIPPKKGKKHVLRLLSTVFNHQAKSKKTNIGQALESMLRMLKKKAIVFVISDFFDEGFDTPLKLAAKKHDLIPIVLRDNKELSFPKKGIFTLEDAESGKTQLINFGDTEVQNKLSNIIYARELVLDRLFKSIGTTPIKMTVGDSYVKPLKTYFSSRGR